MQMRNLLFIPVLALVLTFGCAKKQTEVATDTIDQQTINLQTAVTTISDGRILFPFDKFDIQPEYQQMLQNKAELMKQYPNIRVRIEGNCDERGTQEYNMALGERRARAAYDYLTTLGVNPAQLEMISFGKENPILQGSGEDIWGQNRRDDFRVIAQ